ncbi:hypothetical protein PybrP1_008013 [[Pythium] brassicae (nom. inval.)]|nr:hypothetical protein PybrP1_008013 [[Pythium] brassicae (nom. inval.)]
MADVAAWDSSSTAIGGPDALRRVHIIDDLLGAVLLLAASTLVVALELTRRQACAVHQLAFALCTSWLFFIAGGLVDHHVSDHQLSLALFGSYLSTGSYVYAPVAVACLVSVAFVLQLSWCSSCECCCIAAGVSSSSSHKPCFDARLRSHASLYVACFASLFIAVGTRLNVRLRGSAINPMGGTLHWTMFRSAFFMSVIHVCALLLIALKLFLQHVRAPSLNLTTLRRPVDTKSSLARSPSLPSYSPATDTDTPYASTSQVVPTESSRRVPVHKRTSSTQSLRDIESGGDGDVSALISSDSENDEDVLLPSFKATGPNAHLPPIHHHAPHQQFATKSSKSTSASSTSGYSSSPPCSPVSSGSSSSSSSVFSFSSGVPVARLHQQHQQHQQQSYKRAAPAPRPRSSSSLSTSSGTNRMSISDSDDPAMSGASAASDYYSDRPSSASSSAGSCGLRRRGAAQILTLHHPATAATSAQRTTAAGSGEPRASEWLKCFDTVSSSVYFYNQRTGESRWER